MAFNPQQFIANTRAKNPGIRDDEIYDLMVAEQRRSAPPESRSVAGELLPTIAGVGGGIVGGIAGAAVAGVGAIPGSIAGATAGAAGGEFLQQKIEKAVSGRERYDVPQIAATGVTSGVLEATGAGAVKLAGAGLKAARMPMLRFVSKFSGYPEKLVENILERGPGVQAGATGGETALNTVIVRTAQGVQKFAATALKESKKKIAELHDAAQPLQELFQSVEKNFRTKFQYTIKTYNPLPAIRNTLRNAHNIGVTKDSILLFGRAVQPSRIVSAADRNAVQEAYNAVLTLAKTKTIKHIDAVMEKLIALRSKTPSGTPTGGETKQLIGMMMDETKKFLRGVKTQGRNAYKEYADFLDDNLPKRQLIEDAKELFGATANISAKEVTKISNTLFQLYNTGRTALREGIETGRAGVEQIGREVGEDIAGTTAGALAKTKEAFSFRASELTRARGLVTKIIEGIPRAALRSYAETGKVTGALTNKTVDFLSRHPVIMTAAKVIKKSPSATVRLIINMMEDKTKQ